MKAILVGAGGITRELLRRLGEMWEVTVIDLSSERLDVANRVRPFHSLQGDGSSRVVLEEAGLENADAIVAATNSDATNLEVCRLAHDSHVPRLVAVASDPERLPDYQRLEVVAFAPDSLGARRIELSLETRRLSSMAFLDGQAEAMEFRIAPDSPIRDKSLQELGGYDWTVGAILRDGELIVPDGSTVLRSGDSVAVVGRSSEFSTMVRTFTSGEGRFPLDYGKRVTVALEGPGDLETAFLEATHLARNSRASSLLIVHRDPEALSDETHADHIRHLIGKAEELAEGVEVRTRPVRERPDRALERLPKQESVGVIVVKAGGAEAWSARRILALVRRSKRPVLAAWGTHPYKRILAPARLTPAGQAAARCAIDLALFGKAELTAVAIEDPDFITGPVAPVSGRDALVWLEEEAAVHGVRVHGIIRRGNPVRVYRELALQSDLLVLGVPATSDGYPWRLGVGGLVAKSVRQSTLLIPVTGGS